MPLEALKELYKQKDISGPRIGKHNALKTAMIPKLIYRYSVTPIGIPAALLFCLVLFCLQKLTS